MVGTSGVLSIISSVPMDSDSLMMITGSCCVLHPEELVDPEESLVFGVGGVLLRRSSKSDIGVILRIYI